MERGTEATVIGQAHSAREPGFLARLFMNVAIVAAVSTSLPLAAAFFDPPEHPVVDTVGGMLFFAVVSPAIWLVPLAFVSLVVAALARRERSPLALRTIACVGTVGFPAALGFLLDGGLELAAIFGACGLLFGLLMRLPSPAASKPHDRGNGSQRRDIRWLAVVGLGIGVLGVGALVGLVIAGLQTPDSADESIRAEIGVQLPASASDLKTGCEEAFMDPDCWLTFSVPLEDVTLVRESWPVSKSLRPRSSAKLQRHLEAMNPEWSDVGIARGVASPVARDCFESDLVIDLDGPEQAQVYGRNHDC